MQTNTGSVENQVSGLTRAQTDRVQVPAAEIEQEVDNRLT